MTLRPDEMTRDCEAGCGRRVVAPARFCRDCEHSRFMARAAWEFCNSCGAVSGRHLPNCTTKENP
jgi:hypothetical protein